MHFDSVFDELGLVGKLVTSTRTSYKETTRSKKYREMQSMQSIELPMTM
jgi:hypothetical protein